jgi:hypothetical protein
MTALLFSALFLVYCADPVSAQQKTLAATLDFTIDVQLHATEPLCKTGFPDVCKSTPMLTFAGEHPEPAPEIPSAIDELHWLPERTLSPIYSEEAELMDLNSKVSGHRRKGCLFTTEDANRARLQSQTGMLIAMGLVAVGVLWALPESMTGWDDEDVTLKYMVEQWWDNVSHGPVWDDDELYLNYIGHPYAGGVYYQIARNSGYSPWDSFVYTALMSTFFWEYGFEAFAEVPSIQDLIVTPVGGFLYGEWAYKTEKAIKANEYRVMGSKWLGYVSVVFLDPINYIAEGVNQLVGREWLITGSFTLIGPPKRGNPNVIGPISICPQLNIVLHRRF